MNNIRAAHDAHSGTRCYGVRTGLHVQRRERHLTIRDEDPHHWLLSAMR